MRTWHVVALVFSLGLVFVAYGLFAPEPDVRRNDAFPDLGGQTHEGTEAPVDPAPLRRGVFAGADDFHFARGNVSLYEASNGTQVLRFEGYDARDGPDVYLYLVDKAGSRDTGDVESGHRLVVPGGEADGRATVRGEFNVWLPAGLDATIYGGVTIWCDQFNHFFGHAAWT